jgi:hypothetical protein
MATKGYANRVINLQFPELAEPKRDETGEIIYDGNRKPVLKSDGTPIFENGEPILDKGQPVPSEAIWVVIRNPRLMPPGELTPRDVPSDPATGRPLSADDANQAMYEIFAKLIIGWRVYDATDFAINPETGEPLEQRLLELPATEANVAKLPNVIVNRIANTMAESTNPQ